MIVAEDGTFDRTEASHWMNLFDIDMKYGDVMTIDSIVDHLATVPAGLFDEQMPTLTLEGDSPA